MMDHSMMDHSMGGDPMEAEAARCMMKVCTRKALSLFNFHQPAFQSLYLFWKCLLGVSFGRVFSQPCNLIRETRTSRSTLRYSDLRPVINPNRSNPKLSP